ncbi:kinase-like domain-containing protein [Gigaspora rosea]|uniref:Kinase-like domain-containing protein n=1 Tax=Gigaspora rosea TaxID=44941 RepID=A0A397W6Z9_9GLOM|nr:kinase-like domain-containing protein [Gigaspora rosea]
MKRNCTYGKECTNFEQENTSPSWCITCDPDLVTRSWTSGNLEIDSCIKEFQLKCMRYEDMIEWIPFNRLSNIQIIDKGGFGSVFLATWLDGIRKIDKTHMIRLLRQPSLIVLKTLPNAKNSSDFLKEFKYHMTCKLMDSGLKVYGLTQNPETCEYLMVIQYAADISLDLLRIHKAGIIHCDLHGGNILQNQQHINENIKSFLIDFGNSKIKDECISENDEIYGVIPYMAPEVLSGLPFTQKADIYSFGVIMVQMTTGQRPFYGHQFDNELALNIFKGLRPEFAPGTPDCYVELAMQCMDLNPERRPAAEDVYKRICEFYDIITNNLVNMDLYDEVKQQFLIADEMIKTLPIILPKHSCSMYTSKLISTQKVRNIIEATVARP